MVKKYGVIKKEFSYSYKYDHDILHDSITSHYRSICKVIKMTHFNKENPEMENIKYIKDTPNVIYIVKNNKWHPENKDYFLECLILNIWTQLHAVYTEITDLERFKESLICEDSFSRIESFMNDFEIFCDTGSNSSWNEQKLLVFNYIVFLSKKIKP